MDVETTYWLVGGGLGLVIAASLGDRARRRAPLAWHAHLPWHAMIFVGGALALFATVHLMTLLRGGA